MERSALHSFKPNVPSMSTRSKRKITSGRRLAMSILLSKTFSRSIPKVAESLVKSKGEDPSREHKIKVNRNRIERIQIYAQPRRHLEKS